jgi:hypothetical protein
MKTYPLLCLPAGLGCFPGYCRPLRWRKFFRPRLTTPQSASRPSVTAAGFLFGSGNGSFGISPTAFCTTSKAIWLKSFGPCPRLVDRLPGILLGALDWSGIHYQRDRTTPEVNTETIQMDPLPRSEAGGLLSGWLR